MKEIWKDICSEYQNCELNDWYSNRIYSIKPIYEISNTGKVRNKNTKQILVIDEQGRVTLSITDYKYYKGDARCQFRVSRLMYLTFVGPLNSNIRVTKEMIKNL